MKIDTNFTLFFFHPVCNFISVLSEWPSSLEYWKLITIFKASKMHDTHNAQLVYQFRWNFVTRQKKTRVESNNKKHKDFYHDDEWAQLSESRRTIALHYVEQKASKTVP